MARSPETEKRMKIGKLRGRAEAIRHDGREVRDFNERRGGMPEQTESILRGWEQEAEDLDRKANDLESQRSS